jgi:hypothetical protein
MLAEQYDLVVKAQAAVSRLTPNQDSTEAAQHLDALLKTAALEAPPLWDVAGALRGLCAGKDLSTYAPKEFENSPAWSWLAGAPISKTADGKIRLGPTVMSIEAFRSMLIDLSLGHEALPPVVFFGVWIDGHGGHHLHGPDGWKVDLDRAHRLGFTVGGPRYCPIALHRGVDGEYCPHRVDGINKYRQGHGLLTHEEALTILGIWDMTGDSRPASHSTFIALGRYNDKLMQQLCARAFPKVWARLLEAGQLQIRQAAADRPHALG